MQSARKGAAAHLDDTAVQASPSPVADTLRDPLAGGGLQDPLSASQLMDPLSAPVQAHGGIDAERASQVRSLAADGLSGSGSSVPYQSDIQASFGSYDISPVQAHTSAQAQGAAKAMGASGFAVGNQIALGAGADKRTVAHEVAHSVVAEHSTVQLANGVGSVGDKYENHADSVADAVVRGESAEPLLNSFLGKSSGQE